MQNKDYAPMRVKDVMLLFDVSDITVRRWLVEGLPARHINTRLVLMDKPDVVKWVSCFKPWQMYKMGE
jgi:hypothetical protein